MAPDIALQLYIFVPNSAICKVLCQKSAKYIFLQNNKKSKTDLTKFAHLSWDDNKCTNWLKMKSRTSIVHHCNPGVDFPNSFTGVLVFVYCICVCVCNCILDIAYGTFVYLYIVASPN